MAQQFSLAFVLYKDQNVMMSEIFRNYEKLWGEHLSGNTGVAEIRGDMGPFSYVISFADEPINQEEMIRVARHNALFEKGEQIAKHHRCHAIIGVRGTGSTLLRYTLLTKLMSAAAASYNAVALYLGEQQLYYSKESLLEEASKLKKGLLPTKSWIYYGFYAHDNAYWCYSQGMHIFGREELEISSDHHTLQQLHELLVIVASLMISNHHQYEDGELLEVGDTYLSITHRFSPALQSSVLYLHFENE